MQLIPPRRTILLLLLALLLASCTVSVKVVPPASPVPTAETPSPGANPHPSPTPRSLPGATATRLPAGSVRVDLSPGSTNASIDGYVEAKRKVIYLLEARAGQTLLVQLVDLSSTLALEIRSPDGELLLSAADRRTNWNGDLTASGDYQVAVVAQTDSQNFHISITIPVRISFLPGSVSALETGQLQGSQVVSYVLRARQGQNMLVVVTSANNDISLTISGVQDGQVLTRAAPGKTQASVNLPASQDYLVALSPDETRTLDNQGAGQLQKYAVTFTIK